MLSRKTGEKIIAGSVEITVVGIDSTRVRIGVGAPEGVKILRGELEDRDPPEERAA